MMETLRITSQWVVPEEVLCLDLSWIVSCIYVYYLNFCLLKYFQYGFEFSVHICLYHVLVMQSRWLSTASLMVLAAKT